MFGLNWFDIFPFNNLWQLLLAYLNWLLYYLIDRRVLIFYTIYQSNLCFVSFLRNTLLQVLSLKLQFSWVHTMEHVDTFTIEVLFSVVHGLFVLGFVWQIVSKLKFSQVLFETQLIVCLITFQNIYSILKKTIGPTKNNFDQGNIKKLLFIFTKKTDYSHFTTPIIQLSTYLQRILSYTQLFKTATQ